MILSEEDPAESIVEEVMSTRKIAFDKSKGKGFSMGGGSKAKSLKERKRYKSAKADDKFEPSACCQKYLEKVRDLFNLFIDRRLLYFNYLLYLF